MRQETKKNIKTSAAANYLKRVPQVQGSHWSMREAQTRQARRWKLRTSVLRVRSSEGCEATATSSRPWRHIRDEPYWVGLADWAHSVRVCWAHGRNVLDNPLQAVKCVCSRTGCGYTFHNLGVDFVRLARNAPYSGTPQETTRLRHMLQRREHCRVHHTSDVGKKTLLGLNGFPNISYYGVIVDNVLAVLLSFGDVVS